MKFVHIADMHFDTSFSQINDSNLGTARRLDQRRIFKKIIDFIKENEIDYLFIAGDFYEHKYIKESTIEYINKLFKTIENTKVFITPGNHDPFIKNSFYNKYKWNKNVHIFNEQISYVEDNDIRIYGYGFDDFYYTNREIENFQLDDANKINILVTHATLNGSNNVDLQYNAISRACLERIGFDYVALGHIHKSNYMQGEHIVYPGSTISMGFDEPGSHGMVVGEIIDKKLNTAFIPLDESEFKIIEIDVSEIKSIEELIDHINSMELSENSFYDIYIVGRRNFEIDLYNLKKIICNNNIIKVKNKTKLSFDLERIVNEKSLKGLFVKEIIDRFNSENYDREVLEQALEIGIEILEK